MIAVSVFFSTVQSEPKCERQIVLIHWVYEVKEATIWKRFFFTTRGMFKWPMIINQPKWIMHVIENKTCAGYVEEYHQWSEIIAIKTARLQLLLDLLYNFYRASNEISIFITRPCLCSFCLFFFLMLRFPVKTTNSLKENCNCAVRVFPFLPSQGGTADYLRPADWWRSSH